MIQQISAKKELSSGVILETEPDEVLFKGLFKDILIDNDNIIITDNGNSTSFLIDLRAALSGVLKFEQITMSAEEMEKYWVN